MTYEQIAKANEAIKTTDIKGKDYAEVNQRIKAFRMLHPDGSIATEIVSLDNGVCIMKAIITDEDGKILGTGTAYEKEGSTFINKTSYIENCETSAVGRALGMCGIGIDTSVASAEEVQNAQLNQSVNKSTGSSNMQNGVPMITDKQINYIKSLCKGNKGRADYVKKILEEHGYKECKDMNMSEANEIIEALTTK